MPARSHLEALLMPLTPRMVQIVELAVRGAHDWEIALRFRVSTDSISDQLKRARQLLDVTNRTELAAVYWQTVVRDAREAPCARCRESE